MTAHPDETPTEPAVAVDPPPTGSPVGHLEPEKALATWRAMERSCPSRLDVGMLWASRSEDKQGDAARAPVFGERRWLVTLLPPADVLASFEALGGVGAEAWASLAGRTPRLFVWSYAAGSRRAMLDVEVYEADGLFDGGASLALVAKWVETGEPLAPVWRSVDDLGVRALCHRLAMFCMGDAVARPLRA